MRWLASLGVLILAACSAPPPPPGSEVRMVVWGATAPRDVTPDGRFLSDEQRRYFTRAAGLREAAAAGQVVTARCTMGDGDLVFAHAVLGEMAMPKAGEVIRVRLGNREAGELNRVLGKVTDPPGLTRGWLPYEIVAYRSIVPWSTVAVEGEVSPFVQAQYGKIRSGRVVRCLAP